MDPLVYRYRPRVGTMLMVFLFFGAGVFLLGNEAMTNDRGLILNGIITFDVEGATKFYWCAAALCGAMSALGFMQLLFGLVSNQHVELTETELSAPKSLLSLSNTIVPVASITNLELRTVGRQHFLRVHHQKGRLTIAAVNLPDADAFETLCAHIAALRDNLQATRRTARSGAQ